MSLASLYSKARCLFQKHFTLVIYHCSRISRVILKTLQGSTHAMDDPTYFASVVSYGCEMFMKLTTGAYPRVERSKGAHLRRFHSD
jgi:hypothetical protein